jgi:hypothetical protein
LHFVIFSLWRFRHADAFVYFAFAFAISRRRCHASRRLQRFRFDSPMPHSLRLGPIPRLPMLSPPIFEPVFAASRFRHRLSPPPVHATPPAAATADAATLPLMPPFSHAFHASRHISPPLAAAGRFSRQIFATFSLIFAADSCC